MNKDILLRSHIHLLRRACHIVHGAGKHSHFVGRVNGDQPLYFTGHQIFELIDSFGKLFGNQNLLSSRKSNWSLERSTRFRTICIPLPVGGDTFFLESLLSSNLPA